MVVKGIAAAHYQNFVVDDEAWPPKYWKVRKHAFMCAYRLGLIMHASHLMTMCGYMRGLKIEPQAIASA